MVVVEVLHGLFLFATLLVQEICRDVMQIDKLHARGLSHLTVPLAIAIVPTLYLAVLPLITRCQRDEDWCCTLLTDILDKLLQIPTE